MQVVYNKWATEKGAAQQTSAHVTPEEDDYVKENESKHVQNNVEMGGLTRVYAKQSRRTESFYERRNCCPATVRARKV